VGVQERKESNIGKWRMDGMKEDDWVEERKDSWLYARKEERMD